MSSCLFGSGVTVGGSAVGTADERQNTTGGHADARAVLRRLECCLCPIWQPLFMEKVGVAAAATPAKGGDVTEYLIALNDEWVPDHTVEGLREKSKALKPLVAQIVLARSAAMSLSMIPGL